MGNTLKSALLAVAISAVGALSSGTASGMQSASGATVDDWEAAFKSVAKAAGMGKNVSSWTYEKCGTLITVPDQENGGTKQVPYPCGGIAYANMGAYVVGNVTLEARGKSNQPAKDPYYNADCENLSKKFTANLSVTQYDSFTVPASCAYKLSINISGGKKKDRNFWLTPGCLIVAQTDGDLVSSSWSQDADYAPGVKQQGMPKSPQDGDGHTCGRQNKAGL